MFKRPQYIALSVVLLLALIFISLPSRTTAHLKIALGSLFLPLFGLAGSTQKVLDQGSVALRSKRSLVQELEQLHLENEQLRIFTNQTAQVWEENNQLRQALTWQRQARWPLKPARVILRDPANWWRSVHIDLGHRDGITTNMPVLTTDGLVGKVILVGYNNSQVVLIGDPNCRVSALIEDLDRSSSTRKPASPVSHGVIVSGESSILDPTIVDLTYIDRQTPLKPGQRVLTSGLGGVFPRGIPIGQIADSSSVGYGLYLDARVKLSANLAHLDQVWVMTQ